MVYILGAGGMGRETLNIYKDLGKIQEVDGFIVEKKYNIQKSTINGKKIKNSSIINELPKKTVFIGAMGSPNRKQWITEIKSLGFNFDIVVHPSTLKDNSVKIGEGCIICPGSVLTVDITIGNHSILNVNTSVNHDCKIGDFVTISPGVNIAGNTIIKDGSWIGIGTSIIPDITIGECSFIGAGSVVTKDIPDNVLAVGVPAKPIRRLNKSDLDRLI